MGMLVLLQTLRAYFLTQRFPANDIQSIVEQHCECALQEMDRAGAKEGGREGGRQRIEYVGTLLI